MVKLTAKSAAHGLLPLTIGTVQVTEVADLTLTAIAPYKGKAAQAAQALTSAHGLDWPQPKRATGNGPHAIWFGHQHILLTGAQPDPGLAKSCAVTDQTDAWVVVDVAGQGARDVLSRLTPADMRDGAFALLDTARTEIQHMQGAITRMDPDRYRVMVFRSMARTLVHDLQTAMESVASLSA